MVTVAFLHNVMNDKKTCDVVHGIWNQVNKGMGVTPDHFSPSEYL
jgi:hypothetical protein